MKHPSSENCLFEIPVPGTGRSVDAWYLARGFRAIAGVDEAGRGALAGPVCAAAVVLGDSAIEGLDDSKLLTPVSREDLFVKIWEKARCVGVAFVSPEIIDNVNILRASLEAMRLALEMLPDAPDIVLADGNQTPPTRFSCVALVHGDRRSESIMAASIIAKVSRDSYMRRVAKEYPGYGFEEHKGYGVPAHHRAMDLMGLCPLHRRSYSPCRAVADLKGDPSANKRQLIPGSQE